MKRIIITQEEYEEVRALAKRNKNKRVDRRLQVILLSYEGMSDKEIAAKLDYHPLRVTQLRSMFKKQGAEEYARNKYKGNHRSLSEAEEQEILDSFEEKAKQGQIVTVQDIKAAFDKRIGKDTGRGYIYTLLKRRNWRKVMPRAKHPKKAREAEIDASKKLTP